MPESAHPLTAAQHEAAALNAEQKRKLVERVLASEVFRRAPAMRAFLLYVINQADLGRADQLKEQTIGAEVLGRKPDYDPANDNIVRVRAHELRGRLERYFASEGALEPIVITIPRGGYAPVFIPRPSRSPERSPTPPGPERPVLAAEYTSRSRRAWWVAGGGLLAVACILAIAGYEFIHRAQPVASPSSRAVRDFWAQFFAKPNGPLKVVYADSTFALWQRLDKQDLNLGNYLSHQYLAGQKDELREIVSQRTTSPADLNTCLSLQRVAAGLGGQINAQFSRNATAEFLHGGNVVLIGSRRSNPWVNIYEPHLNFQLGVNRDTGSPFFVNVSPQPHELAKYSIPAMEDSQIGAKGQFIQEAEEKEFVSYGVIALLKGCGTNSLTVLIDGLDMQATQAAGDMITDPQLLERLMQSIGHKPGSSVAPFQALLQVTALPGGYDNPKVIAFRTSPRETCIGD